ncbi:MAG: biopolymer transporter ExbD [SAR324 cluster bacterium]|nr:biopolymer transporter ExbD [SAR324 cluster bacterium]
MGGSWDQNEPLSEINVTPFVDVLLVLLIIFMVTAPIVNHIIQVDLPEDSYNQDKMKPMQEPLRVVIDKSGVLYLGNTRIGGSNEGESQRVLGDKIKQWATGKKKPWLVDVEGYENVDYG